MPRAVQARGPAHPQGGAEGRGYVGPSRPVASLRWPAQPSRVEPPADSPNAPGIGLSACSRSRAPLAAMRVGWCGTEGAELRHLPGGERHRCSGAVPPRDMSQPPGKPGRHTPVRGQHEVCRCVRCPPLCGGCDRVRDEGSPPSQWACSMCVCASLGGSLACSRVVGPAL